MKLYYFPLSTYSQKVTMALEEKNAKAEMILVNLFDPNERETYRETYPLGKIPLLVLDDGHLIPESSIIIEYLDQKIASGARLIPADPDAARKTRFKDRMMDLYVADPVTLLLFQSWKPAHERDAERMERARFHLDTLYRFMDHKLASQSYLVGDAFSMADCAAAAALFYAPKVAPFGDYPNVVSYWERLTARPSHQAVAAAAAPHLEAMANREV